ncbi:pre-rrna-processing protein tsr1 [Nannochloropsis gaditana]|uniref:Pre-rrna-processing protein tsr1 n=1 Tax=Nannochloropsis gaditana TaxID=72520 RepID=W7U3E2_9STRA|nr:pre-rrna-processing protein tsr1 [Nannochloropsis gaditana]
MSEYQASWFEGEEEEGQNDEGGEEEEGEEEEGEEEEGEEEGEEEEDPSLSIGSEQQRQGRQVRQLEKDELEFPDEVQTPDDRPAKERFARYRALKSLRTSPWDPNESLPREYARIFKFSSFAASLARVTSEMEEREKAQNRHLLATLLPPPASSATKKKDGEDDSGMEVEDEKSSDKFSEGFVPAGSYVTLELGGVPAEVGKRAQRLQAKESPLTVFSLLRYENKVSVLHFNILRHPACSTPVKSKDRLVFYTGFRSFEARPVFSEHNLNCDKHKFSRFLHGGRFAVATVFGPVSMPPCPVLVFRKSSPDEMGEEGKTATTPSRTGGSGSFLPATAGVVEPKSHTRDLTLVATGTLHTVDPDRIILKRILLTGYPIRVKRRSAVVKHMFYNPEDVKWFKPAELSTKLGAAGHIREPVGTHGLMKVRFNRIIQQSDTVCLPLFKRVFPKLLPEEIEEDGAHAAHFP